MTLNTVLGTLHCLDCKEMMKVENPDPMSIMMTLSTHGVIFEFLLKHANHSIKWGVPK